MQSFRVKIPTLWRQAFPGLVLGAFIARGISWMEGEAFSLPNTLPLMVIAACMVALLHFLQPTEAGPGGLKAMTSLGIRRSVAWSDIESVTFGRLYWIQPSFKLTTRDGGVLWIARDTKDLRALHAMALECGGTQHPLKRALETPLYAL